jgi:hypothetical protein
VKTNPKRDFCLSVHFFGIHEQILSFRQTTLLLSKSLLTNYSQLFLLPSEVGKKA